MFEEAALLEKEKASVPGAGKKPANSRYFIELHVPVEADATRLAQDQIRRRHAAEFVGVITEWLRDNNMARDVSDLSVTALGQVMIVCSRAVIDMLREQDIWAIAHIRSGDQFSQTSLMKRASGR